VQACAYSFSFPAEHGGCLGERHLKHTYQCVLHVCFCSSSPSSQSKVVALEKRCAELSREVGAARSQAADAARDAERRAAEAQHRSQLLAEENQGLLTQLHARPTVQEHRCAARCVGVVGGSTDYASEQPCYDPRCRISSDGMRWAGDDACACLFADPTPSMHPSIHLSMHPDVRPNLLHPQVAEAGGRGVGATHSLIATRGWWRRRRTRPGGWRCSRGWRDVAG
jgi:hypothetical protein